MTHELNSEDGVTVERLGQEWRLLAEYLEWGLDDYFIVRNRRRYGIPNHG